MPLKILYIVQTFAPVGGMERYVFETAREMVSRGHEVTALCRATDAGQASQISVGTVVVRPEPSIRGWQDRLVFREAVSEFFRKKSEHRAFDIIHSHENTVEQDVSTEHGPCTLAGLRRAPWKFLDYSALRNLLLERAKLCSRSLSAVVSCSTQVEETVLSAYPQLREELHAVIPPAYSYLTRTETTAKSGFTLGFIGADWKRKGLPKALEIFRNLRARDARWTMIIAGVEESRLSRKVIASLPEGVTVAGRVAAREFFGTIDVLVHPAKDEPFGMVIAEALSAGVPTVVSNRCGCAAHLKAGGLNIVELRRTAEDWANACAEIRGKNAQLISHRTWADVAADHEKLYERVLSERRPAKHYALR